MTLPLPASLKNTTLKPYKVTVTKTITLSRSFDIYATSAADARRAALGFADAAGDVNANADTTPWRARVEP